MVLFMTVGANTGVTHTCILFVFVANLLQVLVLREANTLIGVFVEK